MSFICFICYYIHFGVLGNQFFCKIYYKYKLFSLTESKMNQSVKLNPRYLPNREFWRTKEGLGLSTAEGQLRLERRRRFGCDDGHEAAEQNVIHSLTVCFLSVSTAVLGWLAESGR